MKDLQSVFNSMLNEKKELKEIQTEYKNALQNDEKHQAVVSKMHELKLVKAGIEDTHKKEMGSRFEEMEALKESVKGFKEMISDICINMLVDGKSIEVTDEYDRKFVPKYNVNMTSK